MRPPTAPPDRVERRDWFRLLGEALGGREPERVAFDDLIRRPRPFPELEELPDGLVRMRNGDASLIADRDGGAITGPVRWKLRGGISSSAAVAAAQAIVEIERSTRGRAPIGAAWQGADDLGAHDWLEQALIRSGMSDDGARRLARRAIAGRRGREGTIRIARGTIEIGPRFRGYATIACAELPGGTMAAGALLRAVVEVGRDLVRA